MDGSIFGRATNADGPNVSAVRTDLSYDFIAKYL